MAKMEPYWQSVMGYTPPHLASPHDRLARMGLQYAEGLGAEASADRLAVKAHRGRMISNDWEAMQDRTGFLTTFTHAR
jgi:hypothetical protein